MNEHKGEKEKEKEDHSLILNMHKHLDMRHKVLPPGCGSVLIAAKMGTRNLLNKPRLVKICQLPGNPAQPVTKTTLRPHEPCLS